MKWKWKDVEMPSAIAALPRTEIGMPIPWISGWDSDDKDHPVREHNGQLVTRCDCRIGVGVPNLGGLCPERQRAGMLEMLCDACGEPGSEGIFLGSAACQIFREPALHLACAVYSVKVCPGIRAKADTFGVHFATEYTMLDEVVTGLDEAGELAFTRVPHGAMPFLPTMMIYAKPKVERVLSVDQFLRKYGDVT